MIISNTEKLILITQGRLEDLPEHKFKLVLKLIDKGYTVIYPKQK